MTLLGISIPSTARRVRTSVAHPAARETPARRQSYLDGGWISANIQAHTRPLSSRDPIEEEPGRGVHDVVEVPAAAW
jgi:hypothetical protein